MARLNDYTAPPESIEALKRRFVRQNREIARVNSIQSLRIRSLESEVSHLLAENVSLRQQVINLTQETERLETAKSLHNGVYDIKSRLDAKLAELNELTSELGMLPRKFGKVDKTDSERPKAAESRPQISDPEQYGVEDGKLPAILEDKYFPRRTLEAQEIQDIAQMSSSPFQPVVEEDLLQPPSGDIGSPSPSPKVHEISEIPLEDPGSPDPFLPPTLETRKKKKKAEPVIADNAGASPQVEQTSNNKTTQPRKSGSKRKFSPDEDGTLSDGMPESDEFQFSRPFQSPKKRTEPLDMGKQDATPTKTPVVARRGRPPTGTAKRKVLEPKNSNTNLNSPSKARASLQSDNKISQPLGRNENAVSLQKPKGKGLNQAARRPRSVLDTQKEKRSQVFVETDQQHEPAPPHSKHLFMMQEDAMASTSDDMSASRTSRRRGAVVSYAEPNLRAKMRRPTTDMIDAVGKNGARRSSSFLMEGLDEASDIQEGERPAVSPYPTTKGEDDSSDLVLTQKTAIIPSKDEASDQLAGTVSRRRQSRRHSSNPKGATYDSSSRKDTIDTEDSSVWNLSPVTASKYSAQTDGSFETDDFTWNKSTVDNTTRRETRVAARRRSMMV
ncbi:hypothetical protein N7456_001503 [Penicillium angulare]|uniref:Shugoshin n=1 Tax=Penicillium angulare TaxID=116970 RepID=A0A9W9G6P3_9EURO|nr:hypothetical protein N7456_001503 [Penicillium angulare]